MKLKQLQCFLAVVECRSFTKAAANLGIAQPTLSQQIQRLEEELSVRLFDRIGWQIQTTAYGKVLEERARAIVNAIDDVHLQIADIRGVASGGLRLGAIKTLYNSFMVPLCCGFRKSFPSIKLSLHEFSGPIIEEMVCAGDLDLGFSLSPVSVEGIEEQILLQERFVLVTGSDHPLACRRALDIPEIADFPMAGFFQGMRTRERVDQLLKASGYSPNIAVEMDGFEGLLQYVAGTDLCALVPELALRECDHGLQIIELKDPAAFRNVCAIRHKQRYETKALAAFREFVSTETRNR